MKEPFVSIPQVGSGLFSREMVFGGERLYVVSIPQVGSGLFSLLSF
jgi:hypothetical protein